MDEGNLVKIVYEEGETGWAEMLDGDRARIENIPFGDRLNIDDVVSIERRDGRLYAEKILSRTFPKKTALDYDEPHDKTYAKICSALHAAEMKVEGVVDGICIVAHRLDQDPVSVCQQAGVPVRLHETQPDLAEVGPS